MFSRIVDGLGNTGSRGVVGVGIGGVALGNGGELAAGFPAKGHTVAVLGGIAYLVIEYTIPVKVSQEVFPAGGGVGVGILREGSA